MDKLIYGLMVMVIGLVIVFVGLLLIILLIKIMSMILGKMTANKQPKAQTPATPQAVAKPAANGEQGLVVAISAAIAAFTGLDQGHIAIRSIREIIPNK